MTDGLSLFDFDDQPQSSGPTPEMITPEQRTRVRDAFARLGVTEARAQFEIVYELTAQRVRSPDELQARHAQALVERLADRLRTQNIQRTGNAWDDREDDTWIDKL
jgi:hypothetical protein